MGIISKWVGGALSMAGSTASAVGQFKNSMFQAEIRRENAKLKGLARKEMGYRALNNLRTQRLEYQRQVGEQAAISGGSGIAVDDSVSLEVRQNAEDIDNRNRDNAIREHSFEATKSVTEERHMFQQADMLEKTAKITLAANLLIAAGNLATGTGGTFQTGDKTW